MHMALRGEAADGFEVDGQNVLPGVLEVRGRMLDFVDKVHALHAKGEVTDVVNIGIGVLTSGQPWLQSVAAGSLVVPSVIS